MRLIILPRFAVFVVNEYFYSEKFEAKDFESLEPCLTLVSPSLSEKSCPDTEGAKISYLSLKRLSIGGLWAWWNGIQTCVWVIV